MRKQYIRGGGRDAQLRQIFQVDPVPVSQDVWASGPGAWMGAAPTGARRESVPWGMAQNAPAVETRRDLNVPSGASTNPPLSEKEKFNLLHMLGVLDDNVQAMGRDVYGRVANAAGDSFGGVPRAAIQGAGEIIHSPRPGYTGTDAEGYDNTGYGRSMFYGNRALQAGGLTAAGVGLANLTNAFVNSFGGPQDEPTKETLYM